VGFQESRFVPCFTPPIDSQRHETLPVSGQLRRLSRKHQTLVSPFDRATAHPPTPQAPAIEFSAIILLKNKFGRCKNHIKGL